MACRRRHFEARQRREAPECWRHFSVSGWPEVCRARTKACKQVWVQRIIPEQNGIISLKLHHEWHTTVSVWDRRNITRGRWFKMAQILILKRNYNPCKSREGSHNVRAFEFSPSRLPVQPERRPSSNLDYFPISMISNIFRDYYCGIIGNCSKHYIFKKYFLRVNCPFKASLWIQTIRFSFPMFLWERIMLY